MSFGGAVEHERPVSARTDRRLLMRSDLLVFTVPTREDLRKHIGEARYSFLPARDPHRPSQLTRFPDGTSGVLVEPAIGCEVTFSVAVTSKGPS